MLDACDAAGVYVPRLCAYPGLRSTGECGLCYVSIGGETLRACSVAADTGMTVDTTNAEARSLRAASMRVILAGHPHVCLSCPERDGCSRDECTYNNPPEERCCGEFGRCEIAKVASYVGGLPDAPAYVHGWRGQTLDQTILFELDLCVGCGRCVAACDGLDEAGSALELVDAVVRPKAGDLRTSGCTMCGACVMVCPAGALTAAGGRGDDWLAKRRERTSLHERVLPPEDLLPFTVRVIEALVPAKEGVFQLYGQGGDTLLISGVIDLRAGLLRTLEGDVAPRACSFRFEEDAFYTQRESELLARHLQKHGSMPQGDVLEGLFDEDDDL